MFHLTRYKYWFFAVSLIVIVPGLLALGFWGLNLGIDFTGGSTVDLGFARPGVTTAQVAQAFQKAGAKDVAVYAATDLSGNNKPAQYAYIRFDHPISTDEESTVIKDLNTAKYKLPTASQYRTYYTVTYPNAKTSTAMMVVQFAKPLTAADTATIQTALAKLPDTGPAPVTTSNTAKPAASATTTPKATATTSAKATATPAKAAAAATPAASNASGSSTTTAATTPVKVTNVELGANNTDYNVNTQTAFDAGNGGTTNVSLDKIVYSLDQQYGPVYVQSQSKVGPSIANETTRNAFFAVLAASLAIMLYIGIAFHKVGSFRKALRFGVSAIIALLHDVLVVLGVWAILGHFFNFKVDSLFLTAVLTVIGFSVHDTIVVFDRIRENMSRRTSEGFSTVVDASLLQTMTRSLNTSLTVLFTLAALTLFGGVSIREFTLALLIGIMSGTYSSIFNASMILTVWETKEYRNWFRRAPAARQVARPTQRELASTRA